MRWRLWVYYTQGYMLMKAYKIFLRIYSILNLFRLGIEECFIYKNRRIVTMVKYMQLLWRSILIQSIDGYYRIEYIDIYIYSRACQDNRDYIRSIYLHFSLVKFRLYIYFIFSLSQSLYTQKWFIFSLLS